MKYLNKNKAILLLEDGTFFEGYTAGYKGTATGEMCFNTGMTGYQEIYTDPSYFGQIIINTTPHIGNYGTLDSENESKEIQFSGLVCNSFSDLYSRKKSNRSLSDYFAKSNVVAIEGIDTRKLVQYIRSKGVMNGVISSDILDINELSSILNKVPQMDGLELSSKVSTPSPYFFGSESSKFKVAMLDFGIKTSILKDIAAMDCLCKVFPAKTTYNELKEWNADGYFISNGPGDPSTMDYAINTVKNIVEDNRALFGICLGHQLLALASGVSTYKMHHGHRGLNHPVKNLISGRSEITSQNHGFSINKEEVLKNKSLEVTHINLNDGTVEGIRIKDKKVFSVQYHPEAGPGPNDSNYLFKQFANSLTN